MRSNFSKLVFAILLSFFVILAPLPALAADPPNPDPYGLSGTAKAAGLPTNKSIPQLVGQIVGAGLSLLGIVFLGLMIYGGFRWMTARGDTKAVDQAKDTITNAVIGFAIVAGAYAITDFAIGAITGASGGGGGGAAGGAAAGGGGAAAEQMGPPSPYDRCSDICDDNGGTAEDIDYCKEVSCANLPGA